MMRAMLVILACLCLCGCARFGMDNTASGGGSWSVETFHPCKPPAAEPIGGNVRATGNDTTKGGNIDAEDVP